MLTAANILTMLFIDMAHEGWFDGRRVTSVMSSVTLGVNPEIQSAISINVFELLTRADTTVPWRQATDHSFAIQSNAVR
jgi:hypothetical protein